MQTEKVVDHIVKWLKDYATKANVNGFVIGISGGIDSALTLAIAVDAVGVISEATLHRSQSCHLHLRLHPSFVPHLGRHLHPRPRPSSTR